MKVEFAKRLKQLREKSKLSQPALCALTSIKQPTYSNYELPDKVIMPSYITLIKLSRFFGVSIEYLFGLSNMQNIIFSLQPPFTKDWLKQIFSERLKKLRSANGYTQDRMSKELGIILRHYKSYEAVSETKMPSHEKLVCIARIFNCPVDYLLGNLDSNI